MNITDFISKEAEYRGPRFSKENMGKVVDNYKFIEAFDYWDIVGNVNRVPDVYNKQLKAKTDDSALPDVDCLFDHLYTLKTANGDAVWASCPYANGFSVEMVWKALAMHGIYPIEVIGRQATPYADMMILFEPENVAEAFAA